VSGRWRSGALKYTDEENQRPVKVKNFT